MACILIIEDDRAIALGLRLNLRRDGHEVRMAQDGETGLRMALEPEVDLVVLDVMLPHRNGYELLKELRRRGSTASVLMLTAKGMRATRFSASNLAPADNWPNHLAWANCLGAVRRSWRGGLAARGGPWRKS